MDRSPFIVQGSGFGKTARPTKHSHPCPAKSFDSPKPMAFPRCDKLLTVRESSSIEAGPPAVARMLIDQPTFVKRQASADSLRPSTVLPAKAGGEDRNR